MFEPIVVVQLTASSAGTSDTAAGTELDLGPYINVGKREAQAVLFCSVTGTDGDESVTVHLEECGTTVSSDFTDVTGGAFTAVEDDTAMALQTIKFTPTKRYIRSYVTEAGTTLTFRYAVALVLQARFDT